MDVRAKVDCDAGDRTYFLHCRGTVFHEQVHLLLVPVEKHVDEFDDVWVLEPLQA